MDHGDGALVALLLQIGIKGPELVYQEHALIYHGPGGKGADIGGVAALFQDPADHIELPVKVQPPVYLPGPGHEALEYGGHGVPGLGPQDLRHRGDLPPSDKGHPLLAADHLQKPLGLTAL